MPFARSVPDDSSSIGPIPRIAVNGPECIVCEACLFECEGECILITDDEGHVHHSTYK